MERHDLLGVCVRRGPRLLLFRRDLDSALLPGTWETPWVRRDHEGDAPAALAKRYGGRWSVGRKIGAVRHAITRHRISLELREGTFESSTAVAEGREARWVRLSDLESLPHSSLVRKIFLASGRE